MEKQRLLTLEDVKEMIASGESLYVIWKRVNEAKPSLFSSRECAA
jgi:hypothetical protein